MGRDTAVKYVRTIIFVSSVLNMLRIFMIVPISLTRILVQIVLINLN